MSEVDSQISQKVIQILLNDPKWEWRSESGIVCDLKKQQIVPSEEQMSAIMADLHKRGVILQCSHHEGLWGHHLRVQRPMEMSKEEKSLQEQELWEKDCSVDPVVFLPEPGPKNQMIIPTSCGSSPRNPSMVIDKLPHNLIVKALSDALSHTKEVAVREHIKADRNERVNQFIVSLRRHFGYLPDTYRTEREYLSSQLARKEVWYDLGILNPPNISGLLLGISLDGKQVEKWLTQAEAMTPVYGDLKADIERDLSKLQGSIMVAQACNKVATEINWNADRVLLGMAALLDEM